MATQPTVIATSTHPIISHWVTLIKAHEKLLLALIISGVLWHYGDKAYDAYSNHLKAEQSATNAQIAQVDKNNLALQVQIAQLKASVDAKAKIDDAKIAASKQKLVVVQQADAALPLPLLSSHWEDMLKLSPGSITPQTNGTVAVTTDAAHTTVAELEKIPALTDQLAATQDKLTGCTAVRAQLDTQITGLNTSLTLEKTGRAEDAKVAKTQIHKALWKGRKQGFVAGVAVTVAAFIGLFH
jgi:hypothetical protein